MLESVRKKWSQLDSSQQNHIIDIIIIFLGVLIVVGLLIFIVGRRETDTKVESFGTTDVIETDEITYGIDVAKYQGTIDWQQVAASGVDFVMVRVGNRTLEDGMINEDPTARYNIEEASKYGIKVGVYFFSTAVNEKEALEEADWVAEFISEYQISYPVAYNCEGFGKTENRQYSLSKTQRTDLAIVFLDRINEYGYRPMFYGAKNELEDDKKWETSRLENLYKIWVAQYPSVPYPTTEASTYAGKYDMWQHTNRGIVPGIQTAVDMNVAYFGVY